MKINILGSEWEIVARPLKDDPKLEDCDGYCDWTIKKIVIRKEVEGATLEDMARYMKKVTRHEIVHAFLFECGLAHSTHSAYGWATDEEIIDWIAFVGGKIFKAWQDAGVLDEGVASK